MKGVRCSGRFPTPVALQSRALGLVQGADCPKVQGRSDGRANGRRGALAHPQADQRPDAALRRRSKFFLVASPIVSSQSAQS